MSFERIQIFLESNPEYGWMLVFLFGFMESMIITGSLNKINNLCHLKEFKYF